MLLVTLRFSLQMFSRFELSLCPLRFVPLRLVAGVVGAIAELLLLSAPILLFSICLQLCLLLRPLTIENTLFYTYELLRSSYSWLLYTAVRLCLYPIVSSCRRGVLI